MKACAARSRRRPCGLSTTRSLPSMFESEVEAPSYSVVVPFHNEEESVRELHQRLSEAMTNRFEPVEFIFIDDHSTDRTMAVLKEIASRDPRVVVIRLKRNYGQTVAL